MDESRRTEQRVRRVVDIQQEAALERRHWVRIGYACNNRCRFCLDASIVHDRPFVDAAQARAQIDAGRAAGATRLILSGGEASIHPDFLALVDYGRQVGYRRVQTITNGRMFAYTGFLDRALRAGLGEITFSLHSHRAEVHDGLTGVKGAFAQAVRGLRGALAADVVVSVDIVINRENVRTLPETVAWFARMGVTEFDLLHLVPFGRAFNSETSAVELAVPLEVLQPALARTFELAERAGLVIWTNRIPAPALEGYEYTIQDPHKLQDEVRGRHEHLQFLVENGTPLPCRDERCDVCYLKHFCDVLHPLQDQVARRDLPRLLVSLKPGAPPPDLTPYREGLRQVWIRAPDLATGLRLDPPGVEEIWEIEEWSGLAEATLEAALAQRPVVRCVVRRPEDLERLARCERVGGDRKILLDAEGLEVLAHKREGGLSRALVVGVQTFDTLKETLERAVDVTSDALRRLVARGARLEGLPPCLGGSPPRLDPDDFVDLGTLDALGRLDPDQYVQRYIAERYRVHSVRCGACAERARCPGLPVNLVRAQGFGVLEPLAEAPPSPLEATGGAAEATGGAAEATGGTAEATGGTAEASGGTAEASGGAAARRADVARRVEAARPRRFNVNVAWPGACWAADLDAVFRDVDGAVSLIAETGCNQRCGYCAVRGQDLGGPRSEAALLDQAELARAAGFDRAFLVGGEPTLRPGLDGLVRRLRAMGYRRVGIGTNATRLADRARLDRLLDAGVTAFSVSWDSVDPEVQAALAGNPENPAKLRAALGSLAAAPVSLVVFTVMCRPTLPGLEQMVDAVAELGARGGAQVALALVGLKQVGAAAGDPALAVRHEDLLPVWEAACRRAAAQGLPRLDLHLPACVFPDPEGRRWELLVREGVYDPETGRVSTDPGYATFHQRVPACTGCPYRDRCLGMDAGYLAQFGQEGL